MAERWLSQPSRASSGGTIDNNGNTLTKVVGSNTTSYAWGFENSITSVTLPGSGGTVSLKYDPFGRRIYKSSSSATSVYAYDGDNLVEETNSAGAAVARYVPTQNIDEPLAMLRSSATSYAHDAASNRTGFTDPESGSTSYGYDTLNRLQTLTPPSAFTTGSFGFSYDALSRRTQMTRPNNISTNYGYDNLSRLLSVLHQTGSTTLDGATYTVDNGGWHRR